jgi:hypothetical protein
MGPLLENEEWEVEHQGLGCLSPLASRNPLLAVLKGSQQVLDWHMVVGWLAMPLPPLLLSFLEHGHSWQ